ncbi:hypothetical protein C8F04DRAFT_1339993 [Mycena alexandri]|uniref:Uncharacterized protein n=1 Tax=Mycena alexandri TaxID=1745969 RepID=A0AAD6RWU0_9AGAR|nr:hypothetical protein C8F04DRAFT_1339993 [Mycena alexandri]
MSADANSPNSAAPPTDGSTPSFTFLKKTDRGLIREQGYVSSNTGLPSFLTEDRTSISAPAGGRDLRKDGGIPSSPAFASEHAKDADRFAALNLETRDQAVTLRYELDEPMHFPPLTLRNSTQMKRDFLLSQAAPSAPSGFAAGPSLAHRPVSRTSSMAGEVADTPTDVVPDDLDVTPIFLPNHKEVSRTLHLAAPPTTKAGQKEKAETAVVAAARANGNITRLGGKLIAIEAKVDAQALDIANQLRAVESKIARLNPGKMESEIQLLQGMLRNGLDSVEAKVRAAGGGAADGRVSLHGSQLAKLTDAVDTLRHRLDRFPSSLFDDAGAPAYASKADVKALYAAVQEGFDGVETTIAEQLLPTTKRLNKTTEVLEKVEGKVAVQATELLTARENIAGVRIDLASFAMSTKTTAPPASTPSAPATSLSSFEFAVGVKKRKGDELAAETNKRGKPNKAAFHHWVQFGPVNTDTKATGPAPGFFKKVLDGGGLALDVGAPAFLSVGFTGANEANMFVGAWSGANLDPALRAITARLAAAAGPSTSNYSFLTGN